MPKIIKIGQCFTELFKKYKWPKRWVRWKTEWSFDGKLCKEYSYQKLS